MIRPLKTLDDPLWSSVVALYEIAFDRSLRDPLAQFEAEVQGCSRLPFRYLVAEDERGLLGFARWCDLGYTGFLIHLVTEPQVRGEGIGTALLAALIEMNPRLLLEMEAADQDLMRFYERFGARILTPTYTQPALHEDTEPVELALVGIGEFESPSDIVARFYEDVWQLPPDHAMVQRAIEGVR